MISSRSRSPATEGRELPLFLTPDEVASLLRTSRTAVYTLVSRNQLPGVIRLGRRLLFHTGDLLKWLDQNRASSPEE